ncbi:MAG TPA: formyltetrahydrofolate deformylase [Nocardioidaceae bacterium]|nr:formyltetrahydrofolate deformylase [Nocardioidaceae bacterium]
MTDREPPAAAPSFVLTLWCPDQAGIVHAVTGMLVEWHGNIVESQQFSDLAEDRFFLRVKFAVDDPSSADGDLLDRLREAFAPVAERFDMTWNLWEAAAPYRTLILVSKFSHCLNDLLFRWSKQALQVDVVGIVSNHLDCEPLAKTYDVPYHHIPVTPSTKADAEAQMLSLVDSLDVHLVVLARYMQVLSDDTCRALEGRAINIHHSFLPSFKGARPYHQAFDRGVKLVGATAHYVTADLDEGPIIEQDVMRVDHRYDAADLAAAGRDVESQVLSRAVRWHADSRVLVNGHKTVVFR